MSELAKKKIRLGALLGIVFVSLGSTDLRFSMRLDDMHHGTLTGTAVVGQFGEDRIILVADRLGVWTTGVKNSGLRKVLAINSETVLAIVGIGRIERPELEISYQSDTFINEKIQECLEAGDTNVEGLARAIENGARTVFANVDAAMRNGKWNDSEVGNFTQFIVAGWMPNERVPFVIEINGVMLPDSRGLEITKKITRPRPAPFTMFYGTTDNIEKVMGDKGDKARQQLMAEHGRRIRSVIEPTTPDMDFATRTQIATLAGLIRLEGTLNPDKVGTDVTTVMLIRGREPVTLNI